MAATASSDTESLREFIRTHHVRYHVWPGAWRTGPGTLTPVGFALELAADAPHGSEHAVPGCVRCQVVFEGLHRLARAILPVSDRESIYDIGPFDAAWHGRTSPEIVLTIDVVRRGGGYDATGMCQRRCVDEMKERLRALGAKESSLVLR